MRRLGLAMAVAGVAAWALTTGPARADWLSRIVAAGERAGAVVTRRGAGTLEAAAGHLKALPADPKAGALAAGVGHEGHWTFVNRAGERFTASTPDELKRAAGVLAPEATAPGGRLTLVLTEDTAFKHRALLKDLPPAADLRVAVGTDSYPLARRRAAGEERLFAEVRPNVVIEMSERHLFDEAAWQLARPLAKARVRILSLEPGGPETLAPLPRLEPGSTRALADVIDPFKLPSAMRALRGQTALLTGRIEGGLLYFRPSSGPEKSVILKGLADAAEAADVNLIVLRSTAPRQPGGRNWLWQRIEVAGIDTAMQRSTLADFLNALGGGDSRLVVTVTEAAPGRVRLAAASVKGSIAEPSTSTIGDKLSELVSELTGKVVSAAIEADMRSSARDREIETRIVPGVPSTVQFVYLGGLLISLLGFPVALGWWGRIWPAEQRSDYAGVGGYLAARATRTLALVLLFLPLAGPPAALIGLARQGWSVLVWPFRVLRRRLGLGRRQPAG